MGVVGELVAWAFNQRGPRLPLRLRRARRPPFASAASSFELGVSGSRPLARDVEVE